MAVVWSIYVLLPALTFLVSTGLAYWIYTAHPNVRGSRWFVLALLSGSVWMVLHLGLLLSTDPDLQVILLLLATKTALLSFGAWVVFASRYSRRDFHRHPLALVALGLVVAEILLPTLWTPIREVWYRSPVAYTEPFTYVDMAPRLPGLIVLFVVAALVGYGVLSLVRYMLATPKHSGTQLVLLVLATLPIPVVMVLGEAGLFPATELNHAAYGALPFDLLATLALFRFRLFDVQPVARNAVVEQLGDAVFILDGERRLTDFNGAAGQLVDDLDERVGEPFSTVTPAVSDAVADELADGIDVGSTEMTLPIDGQQRHYSVNISPIGDDERNPDWYSIVLRDVTDLERSRWQLSTQNERLDQVASTVSHDLRNPINVAQGFLDVMEDRLDDADLDPALEAEINEYVAKVNGSHDRMVDIIADILTIAREGKTVEETEAVSLAAVAESAWDNVDTKSASQTLVDDVTFQADRSKLLTLFENLFRNAVEHAGDDVTVEVGATDQGFYVQDDGPGIPPDKHVQVFEYGYSSGSGTTGLGLSIVETMAESHGWSVSIAGDYDDGARFEFTLGGDLPTPAERTPLEADCRPPGY